MANDDWIITPRLHFQSDFVFRFWAKCVDYQYLENFNVLYSTTDTQKESFIPLLENSTAYSYYQNYSVNVPKEAKYVAIQCVSDQKRVFCIDDIEYGLAENMRITVDGQRLSIKGDYNSVSMATADGKVVPMKRIANGIYSLNGLTKGAYIISVATANGMKTMKVAVK